MALIQASILKFYLHAKLTILAKGTKKIEDYFD
jgi:hypothetical protein